MTSLFRLEGSGVDPEMTEGLSAPVADATWFLTRQWQVGEFRGEDAASPIMARAKIEVFPLDRFWPGLDGKKTQQARTTTGVPIEALAEAETLKQLTTLRLRIESAQALLRKLPQPDLQNELLPLFQKLHPLKIPKQDDRDPVGTARLNILARKAFDGYDLLRPLLSAKDPEVGLSQLVVLRSVDRSHRDMLAKILLIWFEEERGLYVAPGPGDSSSWVDRQQDYQFGMSAAGDQGPIDLLAPEYTGGTLDWYHFNLNTVPKKSSASEQVPQQVEVEVLASPLRFAGQPAARWWEFEEGDTYFGDLAGGPDDIARSVVAAYGAVAGDDWFLVPVVLPTGHLARVVKFEVRDNFSQGWVTINATAVEDANQMGTGDRRVWRWFELASHSGQGGDDLNNAPFLLLPPVTTTLQQGPILEEVEFRRDEMANIAWAIEHKYEGAYGRSIQRQTALPDPASSTSDEASWKAQLGTEVPAHWLPLLPVRTDANDPQVVLRRGKLAATKDGEPSQAYGDILTPNKPFILNEEEIPAGGLRVTRRAQMSRSADGAAHLWVGRKKSPSQGALERTPLQFDTLAGYPKPKAK